MPLQELVKEKKRKKKTLAQITKNDDENPTETSATPTVSIYKWSKKDIGYFNKSFVEPEMTPDPHEILTPYQYFKLFITDKILEETAFETNQYHIQSHGKTLKLQFSGQELEKFIGCQIRMGLVEKPNQRSYRGEDLATQECLQYCLEIGLNQLSVQFSLSII